MVFQNSIYLILYTIFLKSDEYISLNFPLHKTEAIPKVRGIRTYLQLIIDNTFLFPKYPTYEV